MSTPSPVASRRTTGARAAVREPLGVVLLNLGGPDSLAAVEPFLRNLFADPDVIQLPPVVRWFQPLLARLIAQGRGPKARAAYEQIGGRSPIAEESTAQAEAVASALEQRGLRAHGVVAMGCWHPFSDEAVAHLAKVGIRRAVAVPLFPHYSRATTGASFVALDRAIARASAAGAFGARADDTLELARVERYPVAPGYLDALCERVRTAAAAVPLAERDAVPVLFSAHGLPEVYIQRGDPYLDEVRTTVAAVTARLSLGGRARLCFQSRVGPQRWLGPTTEETLDAVAKEGHRSVVVVPIAFTGEHIETLQEIDILYKDHAERAGITCFARARTVGTHPAFIGALADLAEEGCARPPAGGVAVCDVRVARIVVLGGGIAGLTLAERLTAAGHDVTLIDADPRAGGVIRSERRDGFLCETGPQAVLSGRADTKALLAAAGLDARVIWSHEVTRRRFVYLRGALRLLPSSPPTLLKTDLLGAMAKLRLGREPFVGKGDPEKEESVLAFFERRFGAEAARAIGAPAVIGVYAADAATLSIKSAFPRLWELEQKHGSLLRGAFAGRGQAAADGPPRSFAFPDGLEELPRALAAKLGARRLFVARAVGIEPAPAGYRVQLEAGAPVEAERVVVTTPAGLAAALGAPLAPTASAALAAVPFAPLVVTALGFRAPAATSGPPDLGMDLGAYGFVVARGEGPTLLGCQYESSIFDHRAPPGSVLLRALQGGTFEPALVDETDDTISSRAVADLRRVAGLRVDPDFVAVWRHSAAIPQYDLGHAARVRALDDDLRRWPGLHVIGQATSGVGVNDGIAAAATLARGLG